MHDAENLHADECGIEVHGQVDRDVPKLARLWRANRQVATVNQSDVHFLDSLPTGKLRPYSASVLQVTRIARHSTWTTSALRVVTPFVTSTADFDPQLSSFYVCLYGSWYNATSR